MAAEIDRQQLKFHEAFKKRMLRFFPFMDDESLSRAWTLTGYFTWCEGY
jgi:hypothetical protein